jgi:hypothetical protein
MNNINWSKRLEDENRKAKRAEMRKKLSERFKTKAYKPSAKDKLEKTNSVQFNSGCSMKIDRIGDNY